MSFGKMFFNVMLNKYRGVPVLAFKFNVLVLEC